MLRVDTASSCVTVVRGEVIWRVEPEVIDMVLTLER